MAVPKKRTSLSKKCISKNIWKRKVYWAAIKAFSLAKSIFYREVKIFFFSRQTSNKVLNNLNLYESLNWLIEFNNLVRGIFLI